MTRNLETSNAANDGHAHDANHDHGQVVTASNERRIRLVLIFTAATRLCRRSAAGSPAHWR